MSIISHCSTSSTFLPNIGDGYKFIKHLGTGNQGIVELREGADGFWAFKTFRADSEEPFSSAQHEFSMSQRLRHPAFVKIQSMGREQGLPVLKMEYIDGTCLEPGLLDLQELVQVMIDFIGAMNEAYKLGWALNDYRVNLNMLIDKTMRLRLFDLESFRPIEEYCRNETNDYRENKYLRDSEKHKDLSTEEHLKNYFRGIRKILSGFVVKAELPDEKLPDVEIQYIFKELDQKIDNTNPLDDWEKWLGRYLRDPLRKFITPPDLSDFRWLFSEKA